VKDFSTSYRGICKKFLICGAKIGTSRAGQKRTVGVDAALILNSASLTRWYVRERPMGALTRRPAAPWVGAARALEARPITDVCIRATRNNRAGCSQLCTFYNRNLSKRTERGRFSPRGEFFTRTQQEAQGETARAPHGIQWTVRHRRLRLRALRSPPDAMGARGCAASRPPRASSEDGGGS